MNTGGVRTNALFLVVLFLLVGGCLWFLLGQGNLPSPVGASERGNVGGGGRTAVRAGRPSLQGPGKEKSARARRALAASRAGRGVVEGRVFSLRDGRPLPGVTVEVVREFPATRGFQDLMGNLFRRGLWERRSRPIAPAPAGTGETGPSGRFEIQRLPAGRFWLTLGPGFYYPYRIPGVSLGPGGKRTGVEIAALKGGMVKGRILDWKGRPAAGAVLDLRPGLNSFLSHFFGTGYHWRSAFSDENGRFVLQGVPPGREYVLSAFGPGLPIQVRTDLEVSEGQVLEVDFRGEKPASVAGVVRDTEGRPLPGARVAVAFLDLHELFFSPEACPPVRAGKDGSFEIGNLPPGPLAVAARMEGKGLADPEEVTLRAGGRVEGIVLVVGEGGAVSGKVTDTEGHPLKGALVEAWNGSFRGGLEMSRLLTFGRVKCRAGADGAFRLEGLSGGRCFLKASLGGYGDAFLPRVKVGSTDVKIRLKPEAGVRGVVLAKHASSPVRRFSIRLRGVPFFARGKYTWDFEDPQGRFFIPGVPSGKVVLRVEARGFVPLDKDVDVKPGEGAKGIILLLERESLVRGRVVDERGNPVAGARVAAFKGRIPPGFTSLGAGLSRSRSGRGGMRVLLGAGLPGRGPRRGPPEVNPMSLLMGWSGPGRALSGPDGAFELNGLPGGKWRITALHLDHAPAEPVEIETSPDVPARDVVLRMREGATLWGYVTDLRGRPVAHAVVAAFSFRGGLRSDTTNRKGLYRIRHLAGGRWYVFKSRVLGHRTRNIAADLLGNMRLVSVRVPKEGKVRLDISDVVEGGVDVEGRVLRGGKPVPGAVVTALTGHGEGPLGIGVRSTLADREGRYRLDSLLPGSYVFHVAVPRGRPSTLPVDVPEGGRRFHKDLELPVSRISGTVLDPAGKPVPGARVRAVPGETPGGGGILSLIVSRGAWRSRTDGDGRFTLERVPGGTYELEVEPPRKRKDLGEASLPGLDVDGKTDLEGIRLVLPPAGVLEGTVRDGKGKPLAGVAVRAVREGKERPGKATLAGRVRALRDARLYRVVTDGEGLFRIRGVPAGKWKVRAEKEGFAPVEARGLELLQGGLVRADLVLHKGGTVKVQVLNRTGSPLPRARIHVLDASGKEVTPTFSAARLLGSLLGLGEKKDRGGWYVLKNVKPGAYTVVVEKPSGEKERHSVLVREGEVTEFRLVLK